MVYSIIKKIIALIYKKKKEKYLSNLVKRGMTLGENVEIISDFFFDPSHCYLITIKNDCTICPNVRLIAHDASTKKHLGYTKIGKITINENCFIGDSAIILPDVEIGPNAIIGAGSIVTRSVPEGAIAVGNPAKIIGAVKNYVNKIENFQKSKKVFGEEYLIANLDETKLKELLASVDNGIGFIV